ncbi:ORF6N domain-containing protein [Cryomorpha ignava]|uniref:ORF6N domain-containing protein n=1 Tax=Cryomorpha ignava TaxID=101383 RepID=A0A7K3WTE3_9FLAO|nr:ORF6N domain-containing protein [Cryomorpha ignava]NEN24818.1 ORF6N domain-containing protein [Cryomorpha ignava]
MKTESTLTPERIISKIYLIRDQKVMLDRDLADLYEVSTSNLNKAVSRKIKRFPEDFMFQLSAEEWNGLKTRNETSEWGGTRKSPKAFTEQGLAMLSGVLNSDRAIMVNIQIMRTYTKMREMLLTHKDLLFKIKEMEVAVTKNHEDIEIVFTYLRQLEEGKTQEILQQNRVSIGYKRKDDR